MRKQKIAITLLGTFCILAIGWLTARSQAAKTVQVHMVITDAALADREIATSAQCGEREGKTRQKLP